MKQWIKFYSEALHDRKMRKLSRFDKSVFYDLLLLACQEDKDGYLPVIDDIALELDLKVTEASKAVATLEKAGLLSTDDNGALFVTNYTARQEVNLTPAEKQKRYRDRKAAANEARIDHESLPECYPTVTETLSQCNECVTADKDIDKEKESDIEKENFVTADAATKREKTLPESAIPGGKKKDKLLPEQHDFWNFAKENAGMAEEFYKASGIYPVKKEFGRWINDLRDLAEAEISIPDMRAAVEYMREQNMSIGAPGSLLKTARWLKTKPKPSKRNTAQEESWTERAARITSEMNDMNFGLGCQLPEGDFVNL